MRNRNRLTLTLRSGLAIAALLVPFCPALADDSPPVAVQAATEALPRQTPHFFTGNPTLSGFQRLVMPTEPDPPPVHLSAVTVLPVPGIEVPVVPQPEPEKLAPATLPATNAQRIVKQSTIADASAAASQITWPEKDQRKPHYFPNLFPIPLADRLAVLEQHFATPTALPPRLVPTEVLAAAPPQIKEPPRRVTAPPAPSVASTAKGPGDIIVNQLALNSPVPKPKSPVPFIAQEDHILRGPRHFIRPSKPASLQRDVALPSPPLQQNAVEPAAASELPPAVEPSRPLVAFASEAFNHGDLSPVQQASAIVEPANSPEPPNAPEPVRTLEPARTLEPLKALEPAKTPDAPPQPTKPRTQRPTNTTSTLLNPGDLHLQPAAVAELFSTEELTALPKPALLRLPSPGPEPSTPLVAAAVSSAATVPTSNSPSTGESPAPSRDFVAAPREEFQLASMPSGQTETSRRPAGVSAQSVAIHLQPTEVLPGPTSTSPARTGAIDTERPIGDVTTSVAPPTGRLPSDLAVERFHNAHPAYLPRGWEGTVYFWDAPSMCIGPLRYEEANLERLGYSHCPVLQPAFSGARFLGSTLALPYTIATNPPGTCKYPLGHYRPGSPAPYRHIWPEASVHGATAECLTIAGLILLIP